MVGAAAEALKHLGLGAAQTTRMESNIATAYTLTYLVGLVGIGFFTSQVAPAPLRLNLRSGVPRTRHPAGGASDDDVATQPPLPRLVGRAYRAEGRPG